MPTPTLSLVIAPASLAFAQALDRIPAGQLALGSVLLLAGVGLALWLGRLGYRDNSGSSERPGSSGEQGGTAASEGEPTMR